MQGKLNHLLGIPFITFAPSDCPLPAVCPGWGFFEVLHSGLRGAAHLRGVHEALGGAAHHAGSGSQGALGVCQHWACGNAGIQAGCAEGKGVQCSAPSTLQSDAQQVDQGGESAHAQAWMLSCHAASAA